MPAGWVIGAVGESGSAMGVVGAAGWVVGEVGGLGAAVGVDRPVVASEGRQGCGVGVCNG